MVARNIHSSIIEETDSDRRRGILAGDVLPLDMVSAFAGDRKLARAEMRRLAALEKRRGPLFFSDLLYVITHKHFSMDVAEDLWGMVLHHKHGLSSVLGRNVGITVAALDYLTNVTSNIDSATLVSEVQLKEIVALSLRDELTGLFNHGYFYQQIDFEVRRFVRYESPVSLVLIDIDDFKQVNDTYGHREGDRILAAMGDTLMRVARESDICCRYGGEEFAVILPSTDIHEAGAIAGRLNRELAERMPGGQTVTVSIGVVACGETTTTCQMLVQKADSALYLVKRNGKNRVMVVVDDDSGLDGAGVQSPIA
jgi:diguanylate cyclase (GGDEF)-like protein